MEALERGRYVTASEDQAMTRKAKAEAAADAMAAAEKKKRLSEQRIEEARNAALAAGSGLAGIDSVLN